jgi:hypothetical protein
MEANTEKNAWYNVAAIIVLIAGAIAFMYRPHGGPGGLGLTRAPSKSMGADEGSSTGGSGQALLHQALPPLPDQAPASPAPASPKRTSQ